MLECENKALENKLLRYKKLYRTNLQINLSKDLRIQQLQNILKENSISYNPEKYDLGQFRRYEIFFDERELASLRGLDFQRSSDSAFLRLCMIALYKLNLSSILNKTVTGRREKMIEIGDKVTVISAKEAVSPEKMVILTSIFDERIEGIPNINQFEKNQRKEGMKCVLAKVIDRIRVDKLKSPRAKKRIISD